jgi:uncharacterized membrane protein YgcG
MFGSMTDDPRPRPLPSRGRGALPIIRTNYRHSVGGSIAPLPLEGTGRGSAIVKLVALLCLILLAAFPVTAAEVINNFASNVTLRTDGSVAVTEVVDVTAEGIEIRRGIYRDIPTFLINPDGSRLRASLRVEGVERGGRPEPYNVEQLGNGFVRIRIGDADVFLEDGRHRYTIRYTMTRMVRQFADHDELYWNATGNYWAFPILSAVAAITLPDGAVIADLAGYTGEVGSTEQAVRITRTSDTTATFRTTRALAAGEGLTVAAMFQKGIIAEPSGSDRLLWWISDHRDLIYPLIAVIGVLLYFLLAWSAVGRDPAKGTIIPLFHPPKGFSPALVHYVHRMGWQNSGWTAFTASIFDLGVKGLVVIDNVKKTLKVTVTGRQPEAALPPGEKLLFDYFTSKGSVTVNTTNGPKLNETRGDFVKALETENRQVYFNNHTGYVLAGVALSLAAIGALVLLDVVRPLYLILGIVGGIVIGLFAGLFKRVVSGNAGSIFIFVVWGFIALANFGSGLLSWFSEFRIDTPIVAAASIVVINVIFAVLMRAPTVQGRKVMDQIDGFKMYLETAEANRLNIEGEPPMTIERFERILPYAIALDVEKPWSDHFEAELKRNAVSDAADGSYHPRWYHGSDWSSSRGGFSNAVNAATAGMAAAMIAAQPVQSSSSGFSSGGGGGGSSGGGGGGGGGGGW